MFTCFCCKLTDVQILKKQLMVLAVAKKMFKLGDVDAK